MNIIEMISISNEWGGIEQHVKDLVQYFGARNHNVEVITRPVDLYIQEYSKLCPVHVLPLKGAADLRSIRALARLIKEKDIDIVHSHTFKDAWIALFATMLAGRGKAVTTRHGPFPAKKDKFHTWFYNHLAGIICVSRYVKDAFLGVDPVVRTEHVQVVYPGINLEKFKNAPVKNIRQELAIADAEFIVGFVGRVTREKGLDDLIKALAILKRDNVSVKLLLVGGVNPITPEYLDNLRNLAIELQVEKQIIFYGFSDDVVSIMNTVDVLVLPSVIPESLGLVLAEAMLCGKPVIATTTGAQAELVEDGEAGLLVPPNSPDKIAKAIKLLATDKNRAEQMGNRGRKIVNDKFSNKQMIEQLLAFFEKCLINSASRSVDQTYSNILVHNLMNIGDVVLSTSVAAMIKKNCPRARITMMVRPVAEAIVRNNAVIDDVIVVGYSSKKMSLGPLMRLISDLKSRDFDLSISLDGKSRSAWLTFLAGIPVRIAPASLHGAKTKLTWLYTGVIPVPGYREDHQAHILQTVAKRFLGMTSFLKPVMAKCEKKNEERAQTLLKRLHPASKKIGLCIRGTFPLKNWPVESFAELVDKVRSNYDASFYIVGSAEDREYADAMSRLSSQRILNLCGETTLVDLAALISHTDLFITVDTGTMHIAATTDTPMIAIFGCTSPVTWGPCSDKAIVLSSSLSCVPCKKEVKECPEHQCIQKITVDVVLDAVKEVL